ncbi:MAG: hypothetical protein KC524_12015, partial [Gammaproteobacteria bacterium]|nr:hypothetical protein [Gammaproteobacteria bacterium]
GRVAEARRFARVRPSVFVASLGYEPKLGRVAEARRFARVRPSVFVASLGYEPKLVSITA